MRFGVPDWDIDHLDRLQVWRVPLNGCAVLLIEEDGFLLALLDLF